MPWLTRVVAIALAAVALQAQAEPVIGNFVAKFPEVFAPATSFSYPIEARAWSIWGYPNTSTADVRIDVSCGSFDGFGTSAMTKPDTDGWVSTPVYRSPAQPQECTMIFSEVGGTASLALPLHIYDFAAVVTSPDLSGGIVTRDKNPFSFVLEFHTAGGQPIANNQVLVFPSKTQGASAELDNYFFWLTDIDGKRVVNGTANNASGSYELIVELQYGRRWSIPVRQRPG